MAHGADAVVVFDGKSYLAMRRVLAKIMQITNGMDSSANTHTYTYCFPNTGMSNHFPSLRVRTQENYTARITVAFLYTSKTFS